MQAAEGGAVGTEAVLGSGGAPQTLHPQGSSLSPSQGGSDKGIETAPERCTVFIFSDDYMSETWPGAEGTRGEPIVRVNVPACR